MRMSPSLTENCFPCVLIVAFISSKGGNKGSRTGVIKDLFTDCGKSLHRIGIQAARACLRAGNGSAKPCPMARLIPPAELRDKDTVALARWLLGKALVRTTATDAMRHTITEIEAY